MNLYLYDTTLRDGNQDRNVNFSLADKLQLTWLFDSFGFDYVEGGWPNPSNPLDEEYFKRVKSLKLQHSKVAAFCSTKRPGLLPENDQLLQALVKSEAEVKTIFGKSWDLQVTDVIHTSLEENLDMIGSTVSYLKKYSSEVVYDAEHFFDGYKANPEYALKTLETAVSAGADFLVLCDTNGGTLPWDLRSIVDVVRGEFPTRLGIHAHNDMGTAVANSMYAARTGCCMIQGVVNGFGERCGNADLVTLMANFGLKTDNFTFEAKKNLKDLKKFSDNVNEIANVQSNVHAPYVGNAAFAHKGGAHIDGVLKNTQSFEHTDPANVGNRRVFVTSDQAGSSLLVEKLQEMNLYYDKKDPKVKELLVKLKEFENNGWHFDTADASFKLFVYRNLVEYFKEPFKVINYKVLDQLNPEGVGVSVATVKLKVNDEETLVACEGDGPVNALDNALRKALEPYFPEIKNVKLDDFKVQVLGTNVSSNASVRVWATFGNKDEQWHTVGVSQNIIEAAWIAFRDGLTYKIVSEYYKKF